MDQNLQQHFEKIFRDANSPDELFDAFRIAFENKINDVDLYKILLGNMALSPDEIKLFTDKLCEEFKDLSFDLYMWTGKILENCNSNNNIEMALEYYKKAIESDVLNDQPYFSIVKIYNPEIDTPPQEDILQILQLGLEKVKFKSQIYTALADLYHKLNNLPLKQKYITLAYKAAKNEKF